MNSLVSGPLSISSLMQHKVLEPLEEAARATVARIAARNVGGYKEADVREEIVSRIKDEMAREHGYDLDRLGAYSQRRERERAQEEEDSAIAGETAGREGSERAGSVRTEMAGRVPGTANRPGT